MEKTTNRKIIEDTSIIFKLAVELIQIGEGMSLIKGKLLFKITSLLFAFSYVTCTFNITFGNGVTHDISIIDVAADKNFAYPGQVISINVTVKNNGDESETFNVTLYADTTIIGTQKVNNLNPSGNVTLLFQWDTTSLTPCHNWTIKAEAPLPNDNNPQDNTFVDGYVKIIRKGDLNADGKVNILDIVLASIAYNSKPGDENWNPYADIEEPYEKIDILDLVTIAAQFGKPCN